MHFVKNDVKDPSSKLLSSRLRATLRAYSLNASRRHRGISTHPQDAKVSSSKMATPRHVSGRHSSASHNRHHHHHSSFKPEMHPSGVVSGPNSRANSRQHRHHHHHHHHHHRRNREQGDQGGISFVVEKAPKYIMEPDMEVDDLVLDERPFSKRSHHHQVKLSS